MPITIERKIKGPQTIYRQAEADAAGIAYVPWQEATKGDLALTDDGFVARCEARKDYTSRSGSKTIHLRFSFGAAWLPRTKELLFRPFHESGHYGGTTPRSWQDREASKERTQRTVTVFVEMLVSKHGVNWRRLGLVYRPDEAIPEATVRRLFKQERIKEMVQEELRKVLKEENVDEREVVRMYRKAFEKAEATDNPSAMRAVAKDLSAMLDMRGSGGDGGSSSRFLDAPYTPPALPDRSAGVSYTPPLLGGFQDEEEAEYDDEEAEYELD